MRKLAGILVCCFLLGAIAPVAAFAEDSVVVGDRLEFAEGMGPIIVDNRLMLPLRAVAEAMDATVYWFNDDKRIQIVKYDLLLSLQIGNKMMGRYDVVDGAAKIRDNIEMDVSAMIQNDRTYVPLRAISEAFNAEIQWDNTNRTAVIIPKKIETNWLTLDKIDSQVEGTLCATRGVIARDPNNRSFYIRSLQMNRNGDYDRITFCTPEKTSMADETKYEEYITAYWLEQFGTENPAGTVVDFTGVVNVEENGTYLVVNKTTTGIRSLGYYDTYMDSMGLYYTSFNVSL